MTDTPSSRLRLRVQETGTNVNTWGALLNVALQLVDDAVAGVASVTLTANYSLTSTNYVEDEARKAILKFSGTGSYTVTIPSVSKAYIVWNNTSGTLTITAGAGTTVDIDTGDIVIVFCDAVNVKTIGYGGLSLKAYIAAAALTATGTLPATTGNEGKALIVRSLAATWDRLATTDLSDYSTNVLGKQVALAVAL
ncbi:MAG: hypothetical protein WC718_01435 [Phycisphaerales bacterium]|jgi:hypothetical protein